MAQKGNSGVILLNLLARLSLKVIHKLYNLTTRPSYRQHLHKPVCIHDDLPMAISTCCYFVRKYEKCGIYRWSWYVSRHYLGTSVH